MLAGVALAGLACGAPAVLSPTPAAPTATAAAATSTPAEADVLFIVDGVTAEVAAAARAWGEAAGFSVRDGSEMELSESLTLGKLAFVVSGAESPWAVDEAYADAGVRGIVVEADVSPRSHLSVIGDAETRWDEAGFLAGVLAGYAGQGRAAGLLSSADGPTSSVIADGFEQGVRYSCPRCDVVTLEAGSFDPAEFVRSGADRVFVAPGDHATAAAQAAAESSMWVLWLGDPPPDLSADRLAGRVRYAPEAIVAPALQSLAEGGEGQSWSYSVETASLLLADLRADAISPGKQRLAQEAWDKLARGVLQLIGP